MFIANLAYLILGSVLITPNLCSSEVPCPDGRLCPARWHCCAAGCCAPLATTPATDHETKELYMLPWYSQWPVLFLLGTLSGTMLCCIWCSLAKKSQACCLRREDSERDSAGSLCPPPRYSRCSSYQAPPPYAEVTSKPELYPLVITCGEGVHKHSGGNYLLVQYFKNNGLRTGSLSATSTVESLNSSFICNATNEANTIIPPPYSRESMEGFAGGGDGGDGGGCGRSLLHSLSSITDPRPFRPRNTDRNTFYKNLLFSPVEIQAPFDLGLELIDCERYCDGHCGPQVGESPTATCSPSELDEAERTVLRALFTRPSSCESPPQPTSPTETSPDFTLQRPRDERRQLRLETLKEQKKRQRKASLYMPLSLAYPVRNTRISPGVKASSRSAPATPCGALVPNLLAFGQRVSSKHSSRSSKLEEENHLLIAADYDGNDDPKM